MDEMQKLMLGNNWSFEKMLFSSMKANSILLVQIAREL